VKTAALANINDTVCLQRSALVAGDWTNNFKPMRKLLLKVKQFTGWRVLCRAYGFLVAADLGTPGERLQLF